MSLHATGSLEDAYDATKSLLLPVEAATWLRLAVVALFVGGMGGAPTFNVGSMGGTTPDTGGELPADVGAVIADYLPYIVAVAVVAALLGLLVMLLGSVMEFVFVEALATREVRVRDRFRAHWGDGLRLFGFRLVLLLVGLALVGGAAGVGFLLQGPGIRFLPFLFAIPAFLVVAPVLGLVNGFTTAFVVPVMVAEGGGVLAAWRRFWATLSGEWTEFGVYLVLSIVLGFVAGAAVATAVGVIAALVLLPMGLLAFAGLVGGGLGGLSPLGLALLVVPFLLVAGLIIVAASALVKMPAVTYLRYYALFILGGVDPDLDLVADMRGDEGATAAADAGV